MTHSLLATNCQLSSNSPKDLHICPSSDITFYGDCPVITCPLNITRKTTGTGGCFLFFKNPTIIEAALQVGLSASTAERRYEKAIVNALEAIKLYRKLEKLETNGNYCSKCGVENDVDCTNDFMCDQRSKYLKNLMRREILSNSEQPLTYPRLWKLVLSEDDILKPFIKEKEFKLGKELYAGPKKGIRK